MRPNINEYDAASFRAQFESKNGEPQAISETAETNSKYPSKATLLILISEEAELFHNAEGKCFATIQINGHSETYLLKSQGFRQWLARRFWEKHRKSVHTSAIQEALLILEGKALFEGQKHEVYIRLAEYDDCLYLDLCNEHWQIVEISKTGWTIISISPVRFRRIKGMQPLPEPQQGGKLIELRSLLNIHNEEDWILVAAWLIAALRARGPYPILILHGEQGSAKSTTARFIRALIDPNIAGLRSAPKDERDLMIAATNSWCLAFDNCSYIQESLSNALCRLATGGGFATRELYSDNEETIFEAQRPVLLNGIEEIATRNDLIDRALLIYLPAIPEKNRRTETAIWKIFDEAMPRILGALLNAVSSALNNFDSVKLESLPRMADFAYWATAAEQALGFEPGAFMKAYLRNRCITNNLVLESSPITAMIRKFMTERDEWCGTATELYDQLCKQLRAHGEEPKSKHGWPQHARTLNNQLRRLSPNLRATNVIVEHDQRESGTGRRLIRLRVIKEDIIENNEDSSSLSSQESQLSSQPEFISQLNLFKNNNPDDSDDSDDTNKDFSTLSQNVQCAGCADWSCQAGQMLCNTCRRGIPF